jgi:hypothetical protein
MSLLIIGANDTGKTHFIGQFLLRLRKGDAPLRLRWAPSNLSALEEVLERLNEGRSASHTEADVYHQIDLPLITADNKEFNLVVPDYGGEQVKNIVEKRLVTNDWVERLKQGQGWLFFIRLSLVHKPDDIISHPPGKLLDSPQQSKKPQSTTEHKITAMTFVELLQSLLAISQRSLIRKRHEPILAIILSCWDEIEGTEVTEVTRPIDVLRQKMPMLAEFIIANWEKDRLLVYGLSALEKPLDPKKPDKDYQDYGPENFGYVVTSDGQREKDLTLPIMHVLDLIGNAD